MASADTPRIQIADILAQVQRVRVIGQMHRERFRVVIDGDIDRAAERGLDPLACTAATGEVIYDDFAALLRWTVVNHLHNSCTRHKSTATPTSPDEPSA